MKKTLFTTLVVLVLCVLCVLAAPTVSAESADANAAVTVAEGEIVEVRGTLYYRENGKNTYKGLFLHTDGNYYYAKMSGAIATNVTLYAAKTSCDLPVGNYRFDENGVLANGIFESNGRLRYYENGKACAKGFFKLGEDYYFAKSGGYLVTDAICMPNTTACDLPAGVNYRFDENGALCQGIYDYNGQLRYYENGKGAAKGLFKLGESYYYAKQGGYLFTDGIVYATQTSCNLPADLNYRVDANGALYQGIHSINSTLYYFENGKGCNKGLFELDGKTYFAKETGYVLVSTTRKINGVLYRFDATGANVPCQHQYEEYSRVASDCYNKGSITHRCVQCFHTYLEEIPESHVWVKSEEWYEELDCVLYIYYVCKFCGDDSYWEDVEQHNIHMITMPSCETPGQGECYNGHGIIEIPALGHDYIEEGICTHCSNFEFELNEDQRSYTLTGALATLNNVVIPSTYKGLPVTAIGEGAFKNWFTSSNFILFPYYSDDYYYYSCSVTIPTSVKVIGAHAFEGCQFLNKIFFEEGSQLTEIGDYAFASCFTARNFPEESYYYLFVTLPASVERIGTYAFAYNYYIQVSFESGSRLKEIGDYAFYNCFSDHYEDTLGLTNITIPASVTTIGNHAFDGCERLFQITFEGGSQLQSIGDYAFYKCGDGGIDDMHRAREVYIGMSENDWSKVLIGSENGMFETYENWDGQQYHYYGATFYYYSETQPEGVIACHCWHLVNGRPSVWHTKEFVSQTDPTCTTNGSASYRCTYCSTTIRETLSSLGHDVKEGQCTRCGILFDEQTGLYFKINEDDLTCTVIGSSNFALDQIPSVYNGYVVTAIDSSAFYGCTALKSITIPSSVTSIDSSAFYGCTALKVVTFAEGSQLTSIGSSAFFGCTGLTSITIPSSVTSIDSSAFYGCTALKSITIPESVTSIGWYAFERCTGLTSVIFENPNGWVATGLYSSWDISESYLAHAATAAKCLTYEYRDSYWSRS